MPLNIKQQEFAKKVVEMIESGEYVYLMDADIEPAILKAWHHENRRPDIDVRETEIRIDSVQLVYMSNFGKDQIYHGAHITIDADSRFATQEEIDSLEARMILSELM